ncbi:MAG: hybrid sensor histidine kinase/response regulator [Elusimicrobiales bacterium]|nr:hybrid sensor histidine kinase/response regulator [Elusimicrobiales bacterium]
MKEPIHAENQSAILMVDDVPENLELLSGMLKGRGYKVRAALSGKLALQAIRNNPPDLILLDINMPGMNGYEVCEKLKADPDLQDIPVIFLSALNETMDKVKAFGAGGVDYITKPFQMEEVEARVETHLELRRQKRRLQEAYDKLRELEELRASLVQMIIHDLRSPLTGTFAYLKLIRDNADNTLSAAHSGYVAEAMRAVMQMIQMACDVLETSSMEEGRMKLKTAECDLNRVLEDAISGVKPLSGKRDIRLTPAAQPAIVLADREIILRVIQNLLSNALKFTRDGDQILLSVAPEGDRVRVSVKDSGLGIDHAYKQKIFDKFAQKELRAGNQRYSPGLGLTFCKLAVEAHGGSIGVESEEGKGSTFWFELPVKGAGLQ